MRLHWSWMASPTTCSPSTRRRKSQCPLDLSSADTDRLTDAEILNLISNRPLEEVVAYGTHPTCTDHGCGSVGLV